MAFEAAPRRDVTNIRNWLTRNACIARKETAYLEHGEDLISINVPEDSAMTRLEGLVEDIRVYYFEHFRTVRPQSHY